MEVLEFLKTGSGSGDGSGDGSGSGYGSGSGDGDGSGSGDGHGYGSGDGSGDGDDYGYGYGSGYGHGSGDGYGHGSGSGYGDGYGYGPGCGDGVKSINGMLVYKVDDVVTCITKIKGNIAKGFILNSDLTLTPCVVVKKNNMFAHGKDLHEAMESIKKKLFDGMSKDERIAEFLKTFNLIDKYTAKLFFEWHNKLTGSCEMGRRSFMKNKGITETDTFTVNEFIEKTRDDYGKDVIRQLEKEVNK